VIESSWLVLFYILYCNHDGLSFHFRLKEIVIDLGERVDCLKLMIYFVLIYYYHLWMVVLIMCSDLIFSLCFSLHEWFEMGVFTLRA
jgi:hypothetical protein